MLDKFNGMVAVVSFHDKKNSQGQALYEHAKKEVMIWCGDKSVLSEYSVSEVS